MGMVYYNMNDDTILKFWMRDGVSGTPAGNAVVVVVVTVHTFTEKKPPRHWVFFYKCDNSTSFFFVLSCSLVFS